MKEQDASFPEILIEYPELILPTEPTLNDIEWAKNILKNEGIWIER